MTNNTLEKYYELLEHLGSGTFATVRAAKEKATEKKYAIKIIDKKAMGPKQDMMMREVEILKQVKHSNVIKLKELFESPQKLYLVMELVTGGELFDKIVDKGSYSEKDASFVMKQIVDAVRYLHENNIVHRDLKPENLLLESPKSDIVKIADFGLSKILGAEAMLKTACGTPGYVAPEVLQLNGYGKEVDMWSIGVIMYILLCGFPPFYEESNAQLFKAIMEGRFSYPDPYWSGVSDSAKDLINKLLVVDPKKRLTADQALQHPWIAGTTANPEPLQNEVIVKMKRFNARRKFKMAITIILATIRLHNLVISKSDSNVTNDNTTIDATKTPSS